MRDAIAALGTENLRVVVESREDALLRSWADGLSYGDVLRRARERLRPGERLVTLRDYISVWLLTTQRVHTLSCNFADNWLQLAAEIGPNDALAAFRHPFHSTVLVDTFLGDVHVGEAGCEATVYENGRRQQRVQLPVTGKIYAVGEFGIPVYTGSAKTQESERFEHRWWEFTASRLAGAGKEVALFANGGTIGCFCELVKAHYFLDERGGYYRVLAVPDTLDIG